MRFYEISCLIKESLTMGASCGGIVIIESLMVGFGEQGALLVALAASS